MSISARQLKRQWLQGTGVLGPDPLQPSTSTSAASPRLSAALIDATLAKLVPHDAPWVALACLDAVEGAVAEDGIVRHALRGDFGLLEKIIRLGGEAARFAATRADEAATDASPVSEAKKALDAYQQRLDTLKRLNALRYDGAQASTTATQGDAVDGDDEYDAWADVAEVTPSPEVIRRAVPGIQYPSALELLSADPLSYAMQSAMSDEPEALSQFLSCLGHEQYLEVFARRLDVVKALVETHAARGNKEVSGLVSSRILPAAQDGEEAGLWIDLLRKGRTQPGDEGHVPDHVSLPLTAEDLASFYLRLVQEVAETYTAPEVSLSLAGEVCSDKIGLPTPAIKQLAHDLVMLSQLSSSATSAIDTRTWSLSEYQQACQRAIDEKSIAEMASKFVQNAQDERAALAAFQQGSLRFIDAQKHSVEGRIEINTSRVVIFMLLHLAQNGSLAVVTYLIDDRAESVTKLTLTQRSEVVLTIALGLDLTGRLWEMQRINALLQQTIGQFASTGSTVSLRDHFGALLSTASAERSLADILAVLDRADEASIMGYLNSCSAMMDAMLRMQSIGIPSFSFAWLLQLEHDKHKQEEGLKTIISSLAKSSPPAYKYSDLSATLMECVGNGKILDKLTQAQVIYNISKGAARAGNARTFWEVLENEDDDVLTRDAREVLLYDAVTDLHRHSDTANLRSGDTRAAYDLLQTAPEPLLSSARLQREKAFVEAASKLSSFRVQSAVVPNASITPAEIRDCDDRLRLIRSMLSHQEDAYKAGDIVLDLALKLCAIGYSQPPDEGKQHFKPAAPRSEIECRTLGMLTEAAMAAGDYKSAQESCEKLVADVNILAKRAEQVGARSDAASTQQLQEQHSTARDVAHRTCHQLAKQPDWDDYAARLRWAALALAFCPPEQLGRYLTIWRDLAARLEASAQANPGQTFRGLESSSHASWLSNTDAAASTAAMGAHLSSGLSAALQQARNASSNASASHLGAAGLAALSQFGGSIETYAANPLGALFSRAPSAIRPLAPSTAQQADMPPEHAATSAAQPAPKVDERTARLFDGLGGGSARTSSPSAGAAGQERSHGQGGEGQPAYMDPAERAARAARRFFGGL